MNKDIELSTEDSKEDLYLIKNQITDEEKFVMFLKEIHHIYEYSNNKTSTTEGLRELNLLIPF